MSVVHPASARDAPATRRRRRLRTIADDLVRRRAASRQRTPAGRPRGSVRTPRRDRATCPAATSASATCGRPTLRPLRRSVASSRLDVDRHAERRPAARRSRSTRRTPILALRREELRRSAAIVGIDEVAEHVDVAAALDRGDLDPGDEPHAVRAAAAAASASPADGVVIGDADRGEPGARRPARPAPPASAAVGGGRMEVEIDHRASAGSRRARGGLASRVVWPLRCWRSTSERYSRISSSRCARSSSANSRKICLPSESSNFSP